MKAFTYSITFATALLLLAACKKAEELKYQDDPRVYFTKYIVNPDSVIYSFAVQPDSVITTTLPLTLRIIGAAVDHDRAINIQVDDSSTAKAGYHFTMPPLIMPANAYQVVIPVTVYRRPGLKDSLLHVFFTVKESKDFKPGFDDIPGTLYKKTRLQYKMTFNDYLLKPVSWDCCIATFLGVYSETKFRFVILVTGKTAWDSALDRTPGIMNFVTSTAKNALREYEAANGPLLDENDQPVTFP
jgi:hypothetical protein